MTQQTDEEWWKEISAAYRKFWGLVPMTDEEAQRAYDEAEPVEMTDEENRRVVDYAISKSKEEFDPIYLGM